jgi:CspA family cold shock protein
MTEGRVSGVVKWFDAERGYGFIERPGDTDVFVHVADVQRSGISTLYAGQQVEFDVVETAKGLQAESLHFVEQDGLVAPAPSPLTGAVSLADVFYASAISLFEEEGLDPASVEAWRGIPLAEKDPGFRIDMQIVGPYEGESEDEYFGRQVAIIEGLADLAGLGLVRGAVVRRLRESRGLAEPPAEEPASE